MSNNSSQVVYESLASSAKATLVLENLWTARQLCTYLNRPLSWAQRARITGEGPPYVKVGRVVRYKPSDVFRWLDARTRRSTSDAAAKACPV